jgi:hypothetical protein
MRKEPKPHTDFMKNCNEQVEKLKNSPQGLNRGGRHGTDFSRMYI